MAGTPVSSCVRMVLPTADFSPDHEAPGPFPTVTTFSVTSTWATPGSANNRSARGEPAARSRLSKKNGPPGCTARLTVNLHVSGSASSVSARIAIVASTGMTSDIFNDPRGVELAESPQIIERIDPGAMAVVPVDRDGVIAHAGDRVGDHVGTHALWIQQGLPAHLLHAQSATARQPKVANVEVVLVPVFPEHGQRSRVSPAKADRRRARARRPGRAL